MEDTHVGVGDLEAFLGQAYQESQIRSFFGVSVYAFHPSWYWQPACLVVWCKPRLR